MLGMEREHPRRMISDRVWEELKAALAEAKHSRAGAPAELRIAIFWKLSCI